MLSVRGWLSTTGEVARAETSLSCGVAVMLRLRGSGDKRVEPARSSPAGVERDGRSGRCPDELVLRSWESKPGRARSATVYDGFGSLSNRSPGRWVSRRVAACLSTTSSFDEVGRLESPSRPSNFDDQSSSLKLSDSYWSEAILASLLGEYILHGGPLSLCFGEVPSNCEKATSNAAVLALSASDVTPDF